MENRSISLISLKIDPVDSAGLAFLAVLVVPAVFAVEKVPGAGTEGPLGHMR